MKLKEIFEVESEHGAFFTGGRVLWTSTGDEFLCENSGIINIVAMNNGSIVQKIGNTIEEDTDKEFGEDPIYCFALNDTDEYILTAHKSGLLKLWTKNDGTIVKIWKSVHNGPITMVKFRLRSAIVASGGCDSTIRIWNYESKACLSALQGCPGVIGVIYFHPDTDKDEIFGVGDDNIINYWNYKTKQLKGKFTGHYSKVTSIAFDETNNRMVSSGRDKVLILWDILKIQQIKIIPTYEAIEDICLLPKTFKLPNGFDLSSSENQNKIFIAAAGEQNIIKIWECSESMLIYKQTNVLNETEEEAKKGITQLLNCSKTNQLAVINTDHNIFVYDINSFQCHKQLIGFNDEILDLCFVDKKGQYLAVATNSNDIKLYNTLDMNCKILSGHTDTVLALASHNNLLLSASKDNSIRIWKIDFSTLSYRCVAKGTKHTSSVGSVAFGKLSQTICASVSQDTCLKVWEVPKTFTKIDETISLVCTATKIAHEKDVNCVTISPNDRIIATASQDKTAKLWSTKDLELIGVLRGHRRGVWCVRFSPVDQVLLTSSADCQIRLWSIADMTCLKTLQDHESSVLRAEFISNGMQILSAGADGLLKIWNIKTSECCATMEKHDSRIWSIAITPDEMHFYSGGLDSKLIKWKDVTDEKKLLEEQKRKEEILCEQKLNNLLAENKMLKALKLALQLEKPFTTLKIIEKIIKNNEITGLEETIQKLNELNKENLLKHATTWNANSRNCRSAQFVINILLKDILKGTFRPSNLSKIIEDILPYTERHLNRMDEYLKDLKFIEFTMKCMQLQ